MGERGNAVPVEETIVVENAGDEELVIDAVLTSCECVSAEITSLRLAPSQQTELKISYVPQPQETGRVDKSVYIIPNDPRSEPVELRIKGSFAADMDVRTEIYSKLKCCRCHELFASCQCSHAQEMKTYIDGLLDAGLTTQEIMINIAKKYSIDSIIDLDARTAVEQVLREDAGPRSSRLFVRPTHYDLGNVSKRKKEITFTVILANQGEGHLEITDIKESCSCVSAGIRRGNKILSAEDIRSGQPVRLNSAERADLVIHTDLNHPSVKIGRMRREVLIESNDPVHPHLIVSFEMEVVR